MFRFGLGSGVVAVVASVLALVGCSAEAAADPQVLTNVVPEGAGANCVAGGQAIQLGVDANGSGQLDADEVKGTSYVCNGTTKKIEPVITQIPVGDPRCANGGTLLMIEEKELVTCNGAAGAQGAQGIQGIQGAQGAQGDAGAPAIEPVLGQFLPSQVVKGAVLTCTSVSATATAVTCNGMKLNGLDLRLSPVDANVICGAVSGKGYNTANGLGTTSSFVSFTNGTWAIGTGTVSPMQNLVCNR